jgi:hypothetical protein
VRRRGEVAGEDMVGLDGDNLAVLLPDLLEHGEHELASLGRVLLDVPEAREVFEDHSSAVEVWVFGGLVVDISRAPLRFGT